MSIPSYIPVLVTDKIIELQKVVVKGEPSLLYQLIELFHETAPKRLATIKQSLLQKNREPIARETHILKSSSGNLGMSRVQDICSRIEQIAKQSFDEPQLTDLIASLEDELKIAVAALNSLLENQFTD
jgi:HPt (histidine-containing phosphotransfer) domain-containing protein